MQGTLGSHFKLNMVHFYYYLASIYILHFRTLPKCMILASKTWPNHGLTLTYLQKTGSIKGKLFPLNLFYIL